MRCNFSLHQQTLTKARQPAGRDELRGSARERTRISRSLTTRKQGTRRHLSPRCAQAGLFLGRSFCPVQHCGHRLGGPGIVAPHDVPLGSVAR